MKKLLSNSLLILSLLCPLDSNATSTVDHEGLTYGIHINDSMQQITKQADKYNFSIKTSRIGSEAGKGTAVRLKRDNQTVLIAVLFKDKVSWLDVLDKGVSVNGIKIGSRLSEYAEQGLTITFWGHRDSSLDDLICKIGDNKSAFLIDPSYIAKVNEYQATGNKNILTVIPIKGVEITDQAE